MAKILLLTPCNAIQTRVLALYDQLRTWDAVGLRLDVSGGMAWKVANEGYEPVDPEIRKKLGFPQIIQQTVHRNPDGTFKKPGETG